MKRKPISDKCTFDLTRGSAAKVDKKGESIAYQSINKSTKRCINTRSLKARIGKILQ